MACFEDGSSPAVPKAPPWPTGPCVCWQRMLRLRRCARAWRWHAEQLLNAFLRKTTSRLGRVVTARLLPWKPQGVLYSTKFSLVSRLKTRPVFKLMKTISRQILRKIRNKTCLAVNVVKWKPVQHWRGFTGLCCEQHVSLSPAPCSPCTSSCRAGAAAPVLPYPAAGPGPAMAPERGWGA